MVTLPHITHNGKSNTILAQILASRRITHDAVRGRLSSELPAIISIADTRQKDNGYTLPSIILLDPVESSITLSLRLKHMKKDTGFLSKLKRLSKQGCRRTTRLAHLAQMPAHQLHNPLFLQSEPITGSMSGISIGYIKRTYQLGERTHQRNLSSVRTHGTSKNTNW